MVGLSGYAAIIIITILLLLPTYIEVLLHIFLFIDVNKFVILNR